MVNRNMNSHSSNNVPPFTQEPSKAHISHVHNSNTSNRYVLNNVEGNHNVSATVAGVQHKPIVTSSCSNGNFTSLDNSTYNCKPQNVFTNNNINTSNNIELNMKRMDMGFNQFVSDTPIRSLNSQYNPNISQDNLKLSPSHRNYSTNNDFTQFTNGNMNKGNFNNNNNLISNHNNNMFTQSENFSSAQQRQHQLRQNEFNHSNNNNHNHNYSASNPNFHNSQSFTNAHNSNNSFTSIQPPSLSVPSQAPPPVANWSSMHMNQQATVIDLDDISSNIPFLAASNFPWSNKEEWKQRLYPSPGGMYASDWSKRDFPWNQQLLNTNKSLFKNDSLRPHQVLGLNAILARRDAFVLLPTGGGKSLTFQLSSVIQPGTTVVVMPLLSLMNDQREQMEALGVNVRMLAGGLPWEDQRLILDEVANSTRKVDLLLVTPEKLRGSQALLNALRTAERNGRLDRFVIDEAHCVSQWGHEFRPDYQELTCFRHEFPQVPILALTATATAEVILDVQKVLGMRDSVVVRSTFDRPNLKFEVRPKPRSLKGTVDLIAEEIRKRYIGMSGIVYCLSRKETETVAEQLRSLGVSANFYHGNLDANVREDVRIEWMNCKTQVIVATVAFGMGINKRDCRFVYHVSLPKSVENLYQEAGRAGRDGLPALTVVYFDWHDSLRLKLLASESGNSAAVHGLPKKAGVATHESLHLLLEACMDRFTCRRTLLLVHFSEEAPAQCGMSDDTVCDNCEACGHLDTPPLRDATADVRNIMRIFPRIIQSIPHSGKGSILTLSLMRDIVVGSGKSADANLAVIRGRGYTLEATLMLLRQMVIKGLLIETPMPIGQALTGKLSLGMNLIDMEEMLSKQPFVVLDLKNGDYLHKGASGGKRAKKT